MRSSKYSKRQFIRCFTFGSASTVIGAPWIGTLMLTLLGERRADAATDGQIVLELDQFPALLQDLGSIRVSVTPIDGAIPSNDIFPIIISRASATVFHAVKSACTHRGCMVEAFNGVSIVCPCHGSEFAMDGTVLQGPANSDLERYAVRLEGSNRLIITAPGLGYSITACVLENGASPRVRLEFPTINQAEYRLQFRSAITGPCTAVPFATTLNGAANNWTVTGDGLVKTIFAERPTPNGFYAIALLVKEV